jgi:AcrR family transcriptional regulator
MQMKPAQATEESAPRLRADARLNRQRILDTAEDVFGASGMSSSMEEIARRAQVGVGTIYRNFPTKESLLQAVHVNRLQRLVEEAESFGARPDAGPALFGFFTVLVDQSRVKREYANALAGATLDDEPVRKVGLELRRLIGVLLDRARVAGAVRPDVEIAELIALLTGACLAAEHGSWGPELQRRTLSIIFDGLGPQFPVPTSA